MADNPKDLRHIPRPRGRPKSNIVLGPSVYTRLHESEYDRLIRLANRSGKSVSAVVRQLVVLRLPSE